MNGTNLDLVFVSFNEANKQTNTSERQYWPNIVKLNRGGKVQGGLGRAGQPRGLDATLFWWNYLVPDRGLGGGGPAWRRSRGRESHPAEHTQAEGWELDTGQQN